MSSKGWINDELAKVMIASREGWAISRREFKPGRKNSIQGMKTKSCIVDWKTSYDNIEFTVQNKHRNYFIHPMLEYHSEHLLNDKIRHDLQHLTYGEGIRKFLADRYGTPGHPIVVNERKRNSRILIFERDDHLILDAWTSDVDFDDKWKAFVQYARELVRPESPHMIVDGVLSKNGRRSEYTSYGPPMAHFCCYMFTPVE